MNPTYVEIAQHVGGEGFSARIVFGRDRAKTARFATYAEALAWVVKLTQPA